MAILQFRYNYSKYRFPKFYFILNFFFQNNAILTFSQFYCLFLLALSDQRSSYVIITVQNERFQFRTEDSSLEREIPVQNGRFQFSLPTFIGTKNNIHSTYFSAFCGNVMSDKTPELLLISLRKATTIHHSPSGKGVRTQALIMVYETTTIKNCILFNIMIPFTGYNF